jgi:D-aspartate ligase
VARTAVGVAGPLERRPCMQYSEQMRIEDPTVPVVVLVSSQHGGIGVIRSLGRMGVPVYGVHRNGWEPAARSRFLQRVFRWDFSAVSSADSVSFLLNVARRLGQRPILIATSDVTALLVAENAETLAEAYLFSSPSVEVVRGFSSKQCTFDLCRRVGIPAPETQSPRSREDVLKFAQTGKFPVVVKGENGEFLRKKKETARVAMVDTESELLEIFSLNAAAGRPGILLQEFIPGRDDTICMFNGYFNRQSDCLFGATGWKLRQFPAHRGSTSLGICEKNDVVAAQTLKLMRAVGYSGPLDAGYRFDARDGQYKLLDVNPRIGATFRLFVAENGLDVARALYLDLTGGAIPSAPVREGRKWMVETNDLASSWTYLRERQMTSIEWFRSLHGVQEGVWLARDDLSPLATLPLLWFRKILRRRSGSAPMGP